MADEFEKYLQQNKAAFEPGEPSPRVWEKLQRGIETHHLHRAKIIKMRRVSIGIAASVLLCIGITLLFFLKSGTSVGTASVTQRSAHRDSMIDREKMLAQKIELDDASHMAGITDNNTRQSLYHYTRLIETRQRQMAVLKEADPELYARSQKVLIDLNMQYSLLKKQLPGSPDQQKILKALIQNLKMQEQILTNQLQILQDLQNTNTDAKQGENI